VGKAKIRQKKVSWAAVGLRRKGARRKEESRGGEGR